MTVFLNISVNASQNLIEWREDKDYIDSDTQKDIHEWDLDHLKSAKWVVNQVVEMQQNFEKVDCERDWKMLSREEILSKILGKIL